MMTDETPGKVWICPACGNRYDAPTTCTNEHAPTVCDEYDLAPGDAEQEPAETTETTETTDATEPAAETTDTTEPETPAASPLHDAAAALDTARTALDSAAANLAEHLENAS